MAAFKVQLRPKRLGHTGVKQRPVVSFHRVDVVQPLATNRHEALIPKGENPEGGSASCLPVDLIHNAAPENRRRKWECSRARTFPIQVIGLRTCYRTPRDVSDVLDSFNRFHSSRSNVFYRELNPRERADFGFFDHTGRPNLSPCFPKGYKRLRRQRPPSIGINQ